MRKIINDYPEYLADDNGQIFSLRSNKYLKPIEKANGYLQVNLSIKGRRKAVLIHQLIADAFLNKPSNYTNGTVINHKDGNKHNNKPENLEYVTQQYNVIHGFRTGLNRNYGYNHPNSLKLSNETINKVIELHKEGMSGAAISRVFGFSEDTARRIIKNPNKYYKR